MTDNQCAFSNTFTTLRARGLSQHPADTATSVVSIDSEGTIAIGGLAGAINLLTEARQLLTSNGTESVALDVGTTSQVLTANSSAGDSIKWANLPPATSTSLGIVYGVIMGTSAGGEYNIGYGPSALNPATSGYQNIAVGNGALSVLTSTSANMAVGAASLNSCTTGNFNNAVGPGALQFVTTGSNNVGIGYQSGYNVSTGGSNICIGYQAGEGVTTTANNIIIGGNANIGSDTVADSIVLGVNAVCSNSNECYPASIDHLNVPSLTTLANGTGTLVQYGGTNAGWVQASGGTYNSVEKIDTAISALQSNSSVSTTGPFVPTFSSEVNCTAAAVNSGFSYYGEDFYNLYMLFTLDVTGSSISSFSVNISGIPGEYNTSFTPTAVVSVSSGISLYHSVTLSFSTGSATISLSFT